MNTVDTIKTVCVSLLAGIVGTFTVKLVIDAILKAPY